MTYQTFEVKIENHLARVRFNRPEKSNAVNATGWSEMRSIFETLDQDPEVRVIILSGAGKNFCAGIDLTLLMSIQQLQQIPDEGRKREQLRRFIVNIQDSITAIERCRKPVLAAIHGACIGGAVDIIAACDIRYCTEDAFFSIKEIDLGLVADIGTLQRLPKIIHPGIMAELAFTGRKVSGQEAAAIHLVNRAYPDQESLLNGVQEIAQSIAAKSPLCIRGIKENLIYSRDHSVADALQYVSTYNAAMLLSNDLLEAFQATIEKRDPKFEG